MSAEPTIFSQADDGSYQVALSAASVATQAAKEPIAALHAVCRGGSDALDAMPKAHVELETHLAYRGSRPLVASVGVAVSVPWQSEETLSAAMIEAGIAEFGSTRFTNLTASRPLATEGLDVTVCFPSRLAFWSENTVLVPDELSSPERDGFLRSLEALGVPQRLDVHEVNMRRRQLRRPLQAHQQARAFLQAVNDGFDAALYSAPLPPVQQIRFAVRTLEIPEPVERPGSGSDGEVDETSNTGKLHQLRVLEVYVGRGLSGLSTCSPSDASAIDRFLNKALRVSLADREFQIHFTTGKEPIEPLSNSPRQKGMRFTFWLKGR